MTGRPVGLAGAQKNVARIHMDAEILEWCQSL